MQVIRTTNNDWNKFSFFWFIIWAFNISITFFTSWCLTLAKWPAPHLHPSSLGKNSLRTTESRRMWSLRPAVLAQKKTREQMASPTWDPHFPPGGWFTYLENNQNQNRKLSTCSSRRIQDNTWDVNKPLCCHSAGHTPQKMRHLYNSELLDIYCSQCCKKVNLLNDLEARLRNLKANRYRAPATWRGWQHESVLIYLYSTDSYSIITWWWSDHWFYAMWFTF